MPQRHSLSFAVSFWHKSLSESGGGELWLYLTNYHCWFLVFLQDKCTTQPPGRPPLTALPRALLIATGIWRSIQLAIPKEPVPKAVPKAMAMAAMAMLFMNHVRNSRLEKTRFLPTGPWSQDRRQPCQKRCLMPGCLNGKEKLGLVLVNLVSTPGTVQDQVSMEIL